MMKNIIYILLLATTSNAFSQTKDLKEYGIVANIQENKETAISEIEKKLSYQKTTEVNIRYENGEKITIEELRKPLTIALTKKEYAKILKQKNKTVSLKAIINTGNDMLIERDYLGDDDRETVYLFMLLRKVNGKEYMIQSSTMSDLTLCKKMMELAKTIH
jgi:hypothetical protein